LISAIQSKRGLNAGDLAKLCEIHERTVYRDIDTLNASGVPCAFDSETNGYRIRPGFFMPPVELTFEEAMALVAVLDGVARDGQLPFLGVAARAGEKVRSQLPPAVLEAIEPLDDHVRIDLPATMADESCRDVYDEVRDAIARRRMLRCVYEAVHSREAPAAADVGAEFDFHPYVLWYCQRAWYAVGHHGGRGEVRRLKLNRFTAVRPTDRPYMIPDGFDPRQDLGNAWRMIRGPRHRVAVRFTPAFADNASETRWHPTQEEQLEADGSVTLTFTVDGLDEIVWWVLGYGPGAKVLEPPELIERVRKLAQETVQQYMA
jgi:proteasome accessory factor B